GGRGRAEEPAQEGRLAHRVEEKARAGENEVPPPLRNQVVRRERPRKEIEEEGRLGEEHELAEATGILVVAAGLGESGWPCGGSGGGARPGRFTSRRLHAERPHPRRGPVPPRGPAASAE